MNIYLLILLILAIVLFANLATFGVIRNSRGSRGMKFDWFSDTKNSLRHPFKEEEDQLSELRQSVKKLSQEEKISQERKN